jgi:hypothetical protein
MKPRSIYISLTPEQHRLLQPHFDYVNEQYKLGRPGILIAQVWRSLTEGGEPMMRVGFAEYEKALKIERSMQDDYAEDVP